MLEDWNLLSENLQESEGRGALANIVGETRGCFVSATKTITLTSSQYSL
jgi:hypothetical protein